MIGVYGPGSARDHACLLKLTAEEPSRKVRYYHCGHNAVISREPWSLSVPAGKYCEAAKRAREEGTRLVLITDGELLQTDAVEAFEREGLAVLGPGRHASRVEGSKALMKQLVREAGVPNPESWLMTSAAEAKSFLRDNWSDLDQFVVKTDRLIRDGNHRSMVPESLRESLKDVGEELQALAEAHQDGGLIIERRVSGFETSVHVLWDGSSYVLFPPVRDYKPVLDGDRGPNTNGAAALASGRGFSAALERVLRDRIIEPTLTHLTRTGYGYRGFVYFGVMLTDDGPVLLEINVRPGNPEFVALLGLLASDFQDLIEHAAKGTLHRATLEWHSDKYCGCVFALAEGYPETEEVENTPIDGLAEAVALGRTVTEQVCALPDGRLAVSGGRIAAPVAVAETIEEVKTQVYGALSGIRFKGKHFRGDLGFGIADGLFA